MKTTLAFALVLVGAAGLFGCSGQQGLSPSAPTAITAPASTSVSTGSSAASVEAGVTKTEISGTLDFDHAGAPGRMVVTPSDMCHLWQFPVHDLLTGDVAGPITFLEQGHGPCDFSHLAGSGPFEGEVVWLGRSGRISGQWTTNCKTDAKHMVGLSCDGTMIARGSGGLEGVQFHFKWGPGNYPFPYTGTAFAR